MIERPRHRRGEIRRPVLAPALSGTTLNPWTAGNARQSGTPSRGTCYEATTDGYTGTHFRKTYGICLTGSSLVLPATLCFFPFPIRYNLAS
jgi:hypothetical protein